VSDERVVPVRRALISVADKAGLLELGTALAAVGVAIVSTGSTADALVGAGVAVTPVSEVTGFPEMLGGRVKTLHPRVHAGILADRREPAHLAELRDQGIEPFDLVVSSLYPFERTVASGVGTDQIIEQIDIGGPTLVRAAAKNFESVGVVVNPLDYSIVIEEITRHGGLSLATRLALARKAFEHVARYDEAIASWFASPGPSGEEPQDDVLPSRIARVYGRRSTLRYGENPHQRGGLYMLEGTPGPLGGAEVLQGKEMSFNNWLDAEAARAVAGAFDRPVAVIVKHNNPCGVAAGATFAQAYTRALDSDRVSAFGGIVAFNGEADEEAAAAMAGVFTEVVVAPAFTPGALAAFAERENLRLVRAPLPVGGQLEVRPIDAGALVQDADAVVESRDDMKSVTRREPTEDQWRDLLFAWTVASKVKSNAIVLVVDEATVGVGAGQMNRLYSVDVASRHAGDKAKGSALASDAFFPFRDGVDRAAQAGVAAIIQPGGSMRDDEVVAAAEEHGLSMVFAGRRHFRH
jgi:phosphoribosylaminoimidazolecarboxamide formyltransferase / IMP cyclohydrolase